MNVSPPALAELGILGLDVRKQSRKRTVNDIVAKMLNLRPDILWKRWQRRYIYNIITRFVVSLVLLLCFVAGYFFLPQKSQEDCSEHAEAKKIIKISFQNSPVEIIYVATDKEGGSGSRPFWCAFVSVKEQGDKKYYLLSCPVGCPEELCKIYLDKNIEILEHDGRNGYLMVRYKDRRDKIVYTGIPVGDIVGPYPGNDGLFQEKPDVAEKNIANDTANNSKYYVGGFDTSHDKLVDNFLHEFQMHLKNNDKKSLSEMLQFPQSVFLAGRRKVTVDKNDFIRYFDLIFYPEFKSRVLSLEEADRFCNWRGVCFGAGEIWLTPAGPGRVEALIHNSTKVLELRW